MRIDQAKLIPITAYLKYQGIKAKYSRKEGREQWYSSPLRNGDSTPSFIVNTQKNIWFDHGIAKGGTLIDLVMEQMNVNVSQALVSLENTGLFQVSSLNPFPKRPLISLNNPSQKIKPAGKKENNNPLKIVSVKTIEHPALLHYLQKRKINLTIAKKYGLKEVHYKNPVSGKTHFVLGWPSGEGYEGRNALFKGFIGQGKTYSVVNPKTQGSISIFEGFMDFLSFLSFYKKDDFQSTAIILNSIVFVKPAFEFIKNKSFSKVYLFLDNDTGGKKSAEFYLKNLDSITVINKAFLYAEFNDFNAMIIG